MESITLNMTVFWRTLETLMLRVKNLKELFHKWRISKTSCCMDKQVKWETTLLFSFIQQGKNHQNVCVFDLFSVRDKGKQRIVFVDKIALVISTFRTTKLKQGILKTILSGCRLCSKQCEPAHRTANFPRVYKH